MSRTWLGCVLLAASVAMVARADPPLRTAKFHCSLVGDELHLRIGKPHGRELAVVAPGGVFYLLAFEPSPGAPEKPRPPFDRFARAHDLSIDDVRTLEGWRVQAGQQGWAPIFTRRGAYEFRSADNLSTDSEERGEFGLSTCTVTRK